MAPRGRVIDPRPPVAGKAGGLSPEAAVLALIALSAGLRAVTAWATGLCYGESYYFACAHHPSLSYFDHPPLSILLATASLGLGGEPGRLVLRWPFIALFAGTTWLLFLLGRRLFGAWPGFYAALLMNLAPVFSLSVGIFLQPDGPLMFFWVACAFALVHLFFEPTPRHPMLSWSIAGGMLGLALLSKYTAVLLVAGAGLFVVADRHQRRWLVHPGPYVALAIAALLFSPVLLWNVRHHFISFAWQSTRGLEELQGLRLDWMLRNIAGQSVELLPWVWLALVLELVRCLRPRAAPERRFVGCLAIWPIALFTAVAVYAATGQRHFHWGMPGYALLFLPLGHTLHQWLARGSARARWALAATVILSVSFMGAVASHVATGWLKDGPAWLAAALGGDRDPTLECIDFAPLEAAFAERGLLPAAPDTFVFSDWWFRAGKVDYALKGRLPVLALSRTDPRSFAFFDRQERWLGKDGILVTTKNAEEVNGYYGAYFARIVPLGEVEIGRRGRREIALSLYRCERLARPYPLPY